MQTKLRFIVALILVGFFAGCGENESKSEIEGQRNTSEENKVSAELNPQSETVPNESNEAGKDTPTSRDSTQSSKVTDVEEKSSKPFPLVVKRIPMTDGYLGVRDGRPLEPIPDGSEAFAIEIPLVLPETPSEDEIGKVFEAQFPGGRYVANPIVSVSISGETIKPAGNKLPGVVSTAMTGQGHYTGWLIRENTTVEYLFIRPEPITQVLIQFKDPSGAVENYQVDLP